MFVIVPDSLHDAINRKLDAALWNAPDEAKQDREHMYRQLIDYFHEHGVLPEFTIAPVKAPEDGG